jgi:glycosyltransferase involved in cell wall biosynthesis
MRRDPRVRLVMAGEDPDPARTHAAAHDAGIADRVCMLGPVDPAEMPDLYRLADMVLQPSASEGSSLVCLEALGSGCVLLASDIPASREIVTDRGTGFLFPVGDIEAMAELILCNAADADLRGRIGQAARASSLQRPSLNDNIATFAGLFDRVVATSCDEPRF